MSCSIVGIINCPKCNVRERGRRGERGEEGERGGGRKQEKGD